MYCFPVAHSRYLIVAASSGTPFGMLSDQVYSQPDGTPGAPDGLPVGAYAYPVCADTFGYAVAIRPAATVASYHIAALPVPYAASHSVKPSFEAPGSPYLRTRLT